MLVFISDLHFVDGSAGEHNVPTDAFRIFFEDIAGAAEWRMDKGQEIKEIKIVFLGDIFDLLRTEEWFEIAPDERPWGTKEAEIETHANAIFDAIIAKNQKTFDLLSGSLKDKFELPVEPKRFYIPGNHDRLCNKYDSLRNKVCQWLGIANCPARFDHTYKNIDYGVFARHGHEYDKFNYEGGLSYEPKDYMRVPVGDPITTELVAKLPYLIMKRPEVTSLPEDEQDRLKRNFQDIENVRPLSAVIEWMLYQVKKDLTLKGAIEDSVDQAIEEFEELQYVKEWYQHHDVWTDITDEADQIQTALFLLKNFKVFPSEKLMQSLIKMKDRFSKDDLLEGGLKEHTNLDNRIRYIIYGHTHEPRQTPLRVAGTLEHIYLNSGTWRTRYHKCKKGLGFVAWKNLCYVTFYTKKERGEEIPAFETWTGTLKTI